MNKKPINKSFEDYVKGLLLLFDKGMLVEKTVLILIEEFIKNKYGLLVDIEK